MLLMILNMITIKNIQKKWLKACLVCMEYFLLNEKRIAHVPFYWERI